MFPLFSCLQEGGEIGAGSVTGGVKLQPMIEVGGRTEGG